MILLFAETLGRKLNKLLSAGSDLASPTVAAGSKGLRTVSAEAKYDEQSLQASVNWRTRLYPVKKKSSPLCRTATTGVWDSDFDQ